MAKIKVQGTNVFAFDGTVIKRLYCLKTLDLGSDSPTRMEDTCLEEEESKQYAYGLNDPGAGSLGYTLDDENESHLELIEFGDQRKKLTFYIGAQGSTAVPTVEAGAVVLPTTRSWWSFGANITSGQPTFEPDSFVQYSIPMQRTTKVSFIPKTPVVNP